MKRIIGWLKNLFTSSKDHESLFGKMIYMLASTREEELNCAQVYALLEQFSEAVLRRDPLTDLMMSIEQHLNVCPDCREEYETLLAMMKAA
jgi:hypothetical protein